MDDRCGLPLNARAAPGARNGMPVRLYARDPGGRDAEVTARLAAARAEAQRRVPAWQPWMRDWCTGNNWGEAADD
jgi:hypothetical protein